jgi:hypothetical protein
MIISFVDNNLKKIRYFFLNNLLIIFFLFILFLYISPFFLLGKNAYVLIHDNLDIKFLILKILSESEMIFAPSSTIIEQYMNVPRASLGSEFDFTLLLFYLFEPFTAYSINQTLIRLIAFIGMYLLINRYVFQSKEKIYSYAISLLYALLPFDSVAGLSVAGLPLITYVFLNLRFGNDNRRDWIILFLFPFYSSFVFSMLFFITFVSFVWLFDACKKKVTKKFTIALLCFVIIYLIVNYRLVDVFVFGMGEDFVTHRSEFKSTPIGIKKSIAISLHHFLFGQYHAHSHHGLLIPFIGIIFLINLFSKKKDRLFILLCILNVTISLWYGFAGSEILKPLTDLIKLFLPIQITRFHFLTPLIWFILFALAIRYLIFNYDFRNSKLIVWVIIISSTVLMFFKSDFINEYRMNNITYNQFYSENLFENIEKFIDKEQKNYKVVSIGIHPSIAAYNGFYTLDGYSVLYDLNYKKQFREIIASELKKNEILRSYFDEWGSRVYVFSNEIGQNYLRKKNDAYPININLNTSKLYEMGGRYIFSTYKIKNYIENNLKMLKIFSDNKSVWKIYLYEVKAS